MSGTRGLVPGLRNPRPIMATLPAIYQAPDDTPPSVDGNGHSPRSGFPTGVFTVTVSDASIERDDARASGVELGGEGLWTIVVDRSRRDPTHDDLAPRGVELLDVSFFRDGERIGTGAISVQDQRLEIVTSSNGGGAGTYRWLYTGTSLLLDPIDDPSASRRALLSGRPIAREGFARRFLSVFDESIAPIISTIDNIHAYLDPMLAPEDFLQWIASWFSVSSPKSWPLKRRRERIASAAALFRDWGTAGGLRDYVAAISGIDPDRIEVIDSGGAIVSERPGADLPGDPVPRVLVRLMLPDPGSVDLELINEAVAAAKPAHVSHQVEVVPK